jgi:hypothetical protein
VREVNERILLLWVWQQKIVVSPETRREGYLLGPILYVCGYVVEEFWKDQWFGQEWLLANGFRHRDCTGSSSGHFVKKEGARNYRNQRTK